MQRKLVDAVATYLPSGWYSILSKGQCLLTNNRMNGQSAFDRACNGHPTLPMAINSRDSASNSRRTWFSWRVVHGTCQSQNRRCITFHLNPYLSETYWSIQGEASPPRSFTETETSMTSKLAKLNPHSTSCCLSIS